MAMRVTTGMAMNLYRYNLQNSTVALANSRDKVISQRRFDSFAESPTTAIQAWRIRRAMTNNESYQRNTSDTISRFSIAWQSMDKVVNALVDKDGSFSDIRAMNAATASGKVELGRVMNNTAESVIQVMNSAKYGDHFVFAGDDEMNAPFTWSQDGKTLLYRGIDVNTAPVDPPERDGNTPDWVPASGDHSLPTNMPKTGADANEQAWIDYYNTDWARLDALANEHEFVDLGMGLLEDEDGRLVTGTAFDRSLPGVKMLGYGLDEDGDPKNVVMVLKRLGEIFESCDPETGSLEGDNGRGESLISEATRLMDKLKDSKEYCTRQYTTIDTNSHFLTENKERMEANEDYLQEERANLEDLDPADAITQFSWDYYCYSAALKVGTQLLSQSLIDYMN
ncbi:MAG: hypothetical protein HDT14_08520 [Oscillibacter sp.]|nr:hypothetical protein [Oscillibacter sp.]